MQRIFLNSSTSSKERKKLLNFWKSTIIFAKHCTSVKKTVLYRMLQISFRLERMFNVDVNINDRNQPESPKGPKVKAQLEQSIQIAVKHTP